MPTAWMNSAAAAGLRHSRAPGKSRGRCGKRPYRASGRVVRCGKRRYGNGAFTGLRDQEIGKWSSFSHLETGLTRLFPQYSTQVVDFPHLGYVGLFWEVMNLVLATNGTRMQEGRIDKESRTGGKQERRSGTRLRICAKQVTDFSAKLREVSRRFAQIRAVIPRLFAFLRVGPIFYGGSQEMRRAGMNRTELAAKKEVTN